jgi:hypothetical protein
MSTDIVIIPYDANPTLTLLNCQIEQYSNEPVFAQDGMTVESTRLAISGTCIIDNTTSLNVSQNLERASQRCSSIVMTVGGSSLINLTAGESNIKGPFLKLNATQVVGAQGLCLVRFEINDTYPVCRNSPLLSHTWTQTMSLDMAGHATRTVNGTLRAWMNKDGAQTLVPQDASGWINRSGYADLFRDPILPDVPGYGWRRESQQFAYDATSTGLVYQFVDRQYAYDLPDGVRVGDMEFSYERNLDNPGVANIAFSCDLEGDLSLTLISTYAAGAQPTTGNRYLLAQAIALSKTRINANYGGCLVTRLRVTERDMLSGFKIRLEIDAQMYPTLSNEVTTEIAPIAWMVGQRFEVTRSISRTMSPYGPYAGIPHEDGPGEGQQGNKYAMVPHWISNALQDMECPNGANPLPKSLLLMFEGTNEYGNVDVAVGVDPAGITQINQQFAGKYKADQKQDADEESSGIDYTQIISHNLSLTNANYDTGMVRLSTMYLDKADIVLQVGKPVVRVKEHLEVAKANTAPTKVFRPLPAGAILISENYDVSFGKFDTQGQRMFVGSFDREFQMYDPGGGSGNGFSTQTSVAAGQVRAWAAPNGKLNATLAQIATNASQGSTASVFGSQPVAALSYLTPGETFVT